MMSPCSQYTVRLARWSVEVRPWCASCSRSRVPGLIPEGMKTLFPFMTSPSRIVNSIHLGSTNMDGDAPVNLGCYLAKQ